MAKEISGTLKNTSEIDFARDLFREGLPRESWPPLRRLCAIALISPMPPRPRILDGGSGPGAEGRSRGRHQQPNWKRSFRQLAIVENRSTLPNATIAAAPN